MLLSELENKKIAIWGMGREGQSVKMALKGKGVVLIDKSLETETLENLTRVDVVIKSPGISRFHPLMLEALKSGVKFTTNTNIFLSECRKLEKRPIIIGVTGTKGKSTTSSLIYHGLKKLGKKVMLGGNIGKPLLDILPFVNDLEYVVCELSSYQCAELNKYLDYSIVLNLYKEHIDWHLSHDQYFNDKLNITNYSLANPIVNFMDEEIKTRLKGKNLTYFNKEEELCYKDEGYYYHSQRILDKDDVNVIGDHNRVNFLSILALFKNLKIDLNNLKGIFDDFKPLHHRLEKIAFKNGITYINDSISTTPETTIAALNAFLPNNIILMVGGYDRQQDFSQLVEFIGKNEEKIAVICMYETGKRLYEKVKNKKNYHYFENLLDSWECVLRLQKKDDYVLLSPASPSYGHFKNFEERGEEFTRLVNR
ncbi:MAG: UDP-N-acetylmuramoylalanine--D-glutamate ligase [Alphaproteobacteria bacterium ADurb.Bin438]|nr:MAG: UDP-N-acetylmuramoylalanine--D-glutamate ligase [Alphaproteobacteria bacterium ADurb.Bin438]